MKIGFGVVLVIGSFVTSSSFGSVDELMGNFSCEAPLRGQISVVANGSLTKGNPVVLGDGNPVGASYKVVGTLNVDYKTKDGSPLPPVLIPYSNLNLSGFYMNQGDTEGATLVVESGPRIIFARTKSLYEPGTPIIETSIEFVNPINGEVEIKKLTCKSNLSGNSQSKAMLGKVDDFSKIQNLYLNSTRPAMLSDFEEAGTVTTRQCAKVNIGGYVEAFIVPFKFTYIMQDGYGPEFPEIKRTVVSFFHPSFPSETTQWLTHKDEVKEAGENLVLKASAYDLQVNWIDEKDEASFRVNGEYLTFKTDYAQKPDDGKQSFGYCWREK
jgi:hypothetical protein